MRRWFSLGVRRLTHASLPIAAPPRPLQLLRCAHLSAFSRVELIADEERAWRDMERRATGGVTSGGGGGGGGGGSDRRRRSAAPSGGKGGRRRGGRCAPAMDDGRHRSNVAPGGAVEVIQKAHQRTGGCARRGRSRVVAAAAVALFVLQRALHVLSRTSLSSLATPIPATTVDDPAGTTVVHPAPRHMLAARNDGDQPHAAAAPLMLSSAHCSFTRHAPRARDSSPGERTAGLVGRLLTSQRFHPHGIKASPSPRPSPPPPPWEWVSVSQRATHEPRRGQRARARTIHAALSHALRQCQAARRTQCTRSRTLSRRALTLKCPAMMPSLTIILARPAVRVRSCCALAWSVELQKSGAPLMTTNGSPTKEASRDNDQREQRRRHGDDSAA